MQPSQPSSRPPADPSVDAARMRLLCIDTTTNTLALALTDGSHCWPAEEEGGAKASTRLLPAVAELLLQAGWSLASLDAIAFARGPGAFTGLRTAASVAQGLALGLGCPVLAIDSLMIVAEAARQADQGSSQDELTLWVAMDARMDEIYAAAYRWDGLRWHATTQAQLLAVEGLQALMQRSPCVGLAGSALAAFGDRIVADATVRRLASDDRRAEALARLAVQAYRHGALMDAAQAVPLYVRDKVAQTTAERLALAAGSAEGRLQP